MLLIQPPAHGECDVWYASVDALLADGGDARAFSVLEPHERARHDRYLVEHARREYLATRLFARTLLSSLVGTPPEALRFTLGQWGKPALASTESLRFNLSNTRGIVVCAVTTGAEVGVDVEHSARDCGGDSIAEQYFSRREVAALRALPQVDRPARFFALWTLKEAYIKARGMGLALPLDGFSMLVEEDPIGLAFEPSIEDDEARWHLERAMLGPDLPAAICVERGGGGVEVCWKSAESALQLRK